MATSWQEIVGIEQFDLAELSRRRDANTYTLLVGVLLEAGAPRTLPEVAARLDAIGWAPAAEALAALKRCRPARRPVYRTGDQYALDPHDSELELWKWRYGLVEHSPPIERPRRAGPPVAGLEVALTFSELDEAWKEARISMWSAQRLVLAVLDAAGGSLAPEEVVAEVERRTPAYRLRAHGDEYFRKKGSPVAVLPDGRWAVAPGAEEAVIGTRRAVRERVALARKWAASRRDPAEVAEAIRRSERRDDDHRAELERLRRVLVVAYPPSRPVAVAVVHAGERRVETFFADRFAELRAVLADADVIAGLDPRATFGGLDFAPDAQRVHDLREIRKTYKLNRRRTLKITPELVIAGTCGIANAFGEPGALARYAAQEAWTKLARRLEADAKALFALYEYGRLHGRVRLCFGAIDERLAAPWVEFPESQLIPLLRAAAALDAPLDVVLGTAPSWDEPWARARRVWAGKDERVGWWLRDEDYTMVDLQDVQAARLIEPPPEEWN